MSNEKPVAGVILAGGENRRMNGERKALLMYRGMPFWEHCAGALLGLDRLYLSVDRRDAWNCIADRLECMGIEMVEDLYPGSGPLGAIASVLATAEAPAVLVLPCDMPLLTGRLVAELLEDYRNHQSPVFLERPGGRLHPLVGIYPRESLPLARQLLHSGELRVRILAELLGARSIPIPAAKEVLENINDPDAYRALCSSGRH